MQHDYFFTNALRMNTARPRLQGRLLSTALLAAMLAVGCGDDGTDGDVVGPGANPALPGATGGLGATPTVPGATAGGQVTPTTPVTPTQPTGPVTPTNPTAPTGPTGPAAGADSQWCKVKAILDTKCSGCHSNPPVAGAPFALTTYGEATAASTKVPGKKIFERIGVRVNPDKNRADNATQAIMPPGAPLPAADLATIESWIAAGAPQGENPTCAGTAGGATGGGGEKDIVWPLPECDAVYKITAHGAGGVDTPAMAPPGVESHPQVPWDAPWGDEQVQAIAFKTITDNKDVLHHWILSGRPGGFLTGWAPGEDGVRMMKPDVGMMMPTGKNSLNLDMHYYNTMGTTAKPDKSGVEVCIVKKPKFRKNNAAVTMSLASIGDFLGGGLAPANKANHEVKASCTLGGTQPVTLLSASPHAHKYAVRMKFVLQRKSGETIVMHDQPFMFGEQKSFALEPPVVAQPGDTITTSCFFTNTTNRNITFGESTENEMCFNFAMYYPAGGLTCTGGGGLIGGLGGSGGGGFVSF